MDDGSCIAANLAVWYYAIILVAGLDHHGLVVGGGIFPVGRPCDLTSRAHLSLDHHAARLTRVIGRTLLIPSSNRPHTLYQLFSSSTNRQDGLRNEHGGEGGQGPERGDREPTEEGSHATAQ